MIREDRFVLSRKQFAVDLSSMVVEEHSWYWARVHAVWYRRRRGVTVACLGELRGNLDSAPADAADFLERYTDGRYGGDCWGRWDGERYWGAQEPEVMAGHLAVLRPILADYPVIPDGFDGWYTFQPPRKGA